MADKAVTGTRFLLLALLTFALLGADYLSVLVGKLIDGRELSDPQFWSTHWYATVGAHLSSVLIWCVSALVMIAWARRRGVLDSLLGGRIDRRGVIVLVIGAVLLAGIGLIDAATSDAAFPSLLSEYRGFKDLYLSHAALTTLSQYVYYLLESVMVVLLIAFFQRAGEMWWGRTSVPWGGIGLLATWGAAHLGSHPEGVGIVVAVSAVFGFAFTLSHKSFGAMLALVYLAFVL